MGNHSSHFGYGFFIEKIGNQALLHLLCVSTSSKRNYKVKMNHLTNYLTPVPSVSTNSTQISALSTNPSTRRLPRRQNFQEDWYADFIANDTINIFNDIAKKN